MKITPEIAAKLKAIDLSTKAEIIARYDELSASPLFVRGALERRSANLLELLPEGTREEAVKAEMGRNLRHYAANKRGKIHAETLPEIKRKLGIIFAGREDNPAKAEDIRHLWEYATFKGLSDSGQKKAQTLTDKDAKALDLTAERILSTFERYLLFSLTPPPEYEEFVSSKSMEEEAEREVDMLFADESQKPATSFEEEVKLFAVEVCRYLLRFFASVIPDMVTIEEPEREEDNRDLKKALKSRYGKYIDNNKTTIIC